jgi:hypothetical protein
VSYRDRVFEEDHIAGGEGACGIHAAACPRHLPNLEGCQMSRVEKIFPHKSPPPKQKLSVKGFRVVMNEIDVRTEQGEPRVHARLFDRMCSPQYLGVHMSTEKVPWLLFYLGPQAPENLLAAACRQQPPPPALPAAPSPRLACPCFRLPQ